MYQPQSNGEIERFKRVLKGTISTAKLEGTYVRKAVREFQCVSVYSTRYHRGGTLQVLHSRHMTTKLDIPTITKNPQC